MCGNIFELSFVRCPTLLPGSIWHISLLSKVPTLYPSSAWSWPTKPATEHVSTPIANLWPLSDKFICICVCVPFPRKRPISLMLARDVWCIYANAWPRRPNPQTFAICSIYILHISLNNGGQAEYIHFIAKFPLGYISHMNGGARSHIKIKIVYCVYIYDDTGKKQMLATWFGAMF